MKLEKIPPWVRYLISYAVAAVLGIWLIPIFQEWLVSQTQRTYEVGPLIAGNIASYAVWAVILLFRTHQSTRMGKEGVYVCGVLFLLSVVLLAFFFLADKGWTAKVFLAAEELYDLALLLKARRKLLPSGKAYPEEITPVEAEQEEEESSEQ